MRIKDYLDMIENLPQIPFERETFEFAYYNNNKDILDGKNPSYSKLQFIQEPYRDKMNRVLFRWKEVEKPNIDYKVNDIFISSTNDLVFASLIDLTHRYKFKNGTFMTSDIKSCYINFKSKIWYLSDTKNDKFYCIDDDEIIEKLFITSLNEYPNGIPIIWED